VPCKARQILWAQSHYKKAVDEINIERIIESLEGV
jgi:hypothetical protein